MASHWGQKQGYNTWVKQPYDLLAQSPQSSHNINTNCHTYQTNNWLGYTDLQGTKVNNISLNSSSSTKYSRKISLSLLSRSLRWQCQYGTNSHYTPYISFHLHVQRRQSTIRHSAVIVSQTFMKRRSCSQLILSPVQPFQRARSEFLLMAKRQQWYPWTL